MTGLLGYLAVALGAWPLIRWRTGVTLGGRRVIDGAWRRLGWRGEALLAAAALLWPLTFALWLVRGSPVPRSLDRARDRT